jgi:hypothetical protein
MRSWERAAPALACLTPRDRVLLCVLRELRYLTSEQIHRSCYPRLAARSVRDRLRELRRRELLVPLRRDAFTDRRVFWGLGPLGRAAAALLERPTAGGMGRTPAVSPRTAAVAALQLDHIVATNALYCDLRAACRGRRLPVLRWLAAHRACVDLEHTQLVPDGVVLAAAPDGGWWTYYVERDRGTMPAAAMREKLARYSLLFRMAAAQSADREWQDRADAWLLLVCDDLRRAERLARLAGELQLVRVWAGTAESCAAGLVGALDGVPQASQCLLLPDWAAGALALFDPESEAEIEEESR